MKGYSLVFTIILIFAYIQTSCSFPIRKQSTLKDESKFIYLEGGKIPLSTLRNSENDSDNYENLKDNFNILGFEDRNNYFVLAAKKGSIDIAELGFQELTRERPQTRIPFLNLIHMYFILEEYSLAKANITKWVEKNRIPLKEFRNYMNILEKDYRLEERGMYLEAVSNSSGYELYSWQELGKFFLFQKDYDSAEYYLQKVLEAEPFLADALLAMAELCLDAGRWSELIDYGKAIHLIPTIKNKAYFYIGKGYFESQNYSESVEWLNKAPDSEKNQLDFLLLWRDALIAENPENSLVPLRKHLLILQKEGLQLTEEEILPTLNPHGKEILNGFTR